MLPITIRVESAKTVSDILATWVTILGAFGAGLVTLYEYRGKIHSEEVAGTLRYEERYNSAPILDTRSRLDRFWTDRDDEVSRAQTAGDDALAKFVAQTVQNDKSVENDTTAIINFFEGLSACMCAAACDSQSAVQLFGKEAFEFHGLNFPYIEVQRQKTGDKAYGSGVVAIAMAYVHKTAIDEKRCVGS